MSENLYYTAILIGFIVVVCWIGERDAAKKRRAAMTKAERLCDDSDREHRRAARGETGAKVFAWLFWIGLIVWWIGIDGILASAGIMVAVVFIVLTIRTIWESGR